jgi:FtsP/CotA-like multicopper oxidase with cupredoxin domain
LLSAAVLVFGAGAIHLAVAPDHFQEYLLFGLFFTVSGLAQLGTAVAVLVRPSRRLLVVTASATVAFVLLWLVSRTTGLPVGPASWTPEEIGAPDVVCIVLEVVSVLILLPLAIRGRRPRRRRPVRTPLAAAPVVLLTAVATFLGVGAGLSGMAVAFNAAPPSSDPGGTSVTSLVAPPGNEPVRTFTVTARPATIAGVGAYTYNGTVPGPELRVTQGDRVRVTLVNHLPVSTTLHWHGVRVPNAEDGVAGLTQDAVAPGQSFTYEFVALDAGTYWYHSHQQTDTQISAGLFGALVVEPPAGHTAENVDDTVVLHNSPGGKAVAANGVTGSLRLDARPGQTVRLRVVDAVAPGMDGTAEAPVLLGAPYRVVALDGNAVNEPQPLTPQRLRLGMGQRVDVVFTMPASGAVRLIDSQLKGTPSAFEGFLGTPASTTETVSFGEGAPAAVDPSTLPVFDELSYGVPAPNPLAGPPTFTAPVVLAEGPGFHDGGIELVHTINGAASPDVPPITVHLGDLVRLHLVNNTGEFHPMHLHGHTMSVLDVDGRAPQGSPVRLDTVMVAPHQTVDVAFLADNPGIWMFHCHVLLHASMGMSMTINYAGVTTPFEMGSRSGNVPE